MVDLCVTGLAALQWWHNAEMSEKRSRTEAEESPARHVKDEEEESASREEVERDSSEDAVKEEQQTGGALPDDKSGKED
jgi:hypothetical protein